MVVNNGVLVVSSQLQLKLALYYKPYFFLSNSPLIKRTLCLENILELI